MTREGSKISIDKCLETMRVERERERVHAACL